MKNNSSIFFTSFIQVFLVSANVYFISNSQWYGIAICGFSISYLWTINVKKIGLGTKKEQIIYATGAMFGVCIGVLIAKNII